MMVTDVRKSALFVSRQNVTAVSREPADINLKVLIFFCVFLCLLWRRIRALSEKLTVQSEKKNAGFTCFKINVVKVSTSCLP